MNLSSLDQIQFKWKTSPMNSISVPSGQPSTCNVGPSSTSSPSLSQSHSLPHTSNFPLTLRTSSKLSQSHSLTHTSSNFPLTLQTSKTLKDSSFSLRLFPSLYLSLLLSLFSNTLQTLSDPPRHCHFCILGGFAGGYLGPSSQWLHIYHK